MQPLFSNHSYFKTAKNDEQVQCCSVQLILTKKAPEDLYALRAKRAEHFFGEALEISLKHVPECFLQSFTSFYKFLDILCCVSLKFSS